MSRMARDYDTTLNVKQEFLRRAAAPDGENCDTLVVW
jgi:hypothetical protein